MSESGYVELPVIAWLSGYGSATPGNQGLGWTYRDESAMAVFARPLADPLVESLLVAAIRRINPQVTTDAQALLAVQALRQAMGKPGRGRYRVAGQRHPAGDRGVQELRQQRQGLDRGGAPTAPVPAPGTADAGAQCVLCGCG